MRKKVLFHQDNAPSHKSTVAMTKLRIELWIDSSSILFSGFGPVWLFSVPKLKNLVRWEEILVKWGSHCRRQWVFCRLWDDYFKWLLNVNYASFLAEIWPEGIRRVDLSRCRVIKRIVAFHENLPNLSNDPRTILIKKFPELPPGDALSQLIWVLFFWLGCHFYHWHSHQILSP